MDFNNQKILKGKDNTVKIYFNGVINNDINVVSTLNPLLLSFKGLTDNNDPIEFTIYGTAEGDLVTGYGFAEVELDSNSLSPHYLLSRFFITGSATSNQISFTATGDLRNIYQLEGSIHFNGLLNAEAEIINKNTSTVSGFLIHRKPHSTLTPTTLKRLPDALYNKNTIETNINRLLRAYDKELLCVRTRIKMLENDFVSDLARHIALINNFAPYYPELSPKIMDIEDYRKVLNKINDIILLEDTEDMLRETVRFFTDAEPEIVDLTQYKIQLNVSQLGINTYAADRDIFAFTTKILVANPYKKNINKRALKSLLELLSPAHIKIILQFEDGEIAEI